MSSRRTNLALFVALALALLSGGLAFGVGSGWTRWVVVAHGLAGFAIVVLSPWKSVIARRGLRRPRRGRVASLAFSFLVVTVVLAGVSHSLGFAYWGPVTAMQVHVGAALCSIPLLLWHVVARPVRTRPADLSRRALLRAGAVTGISGLVWLTFEGAARLASLPGARRRATGSHDRGSFTPSAMPVTQWFNDQVPVIDTSMWRLRVGERKLTHDELLAFDDSLRATIDCTGGWFATQDWTGVRLDRLLGDASGESIVVSSVTGYQRRFPRSDAASLLLSTRVGGEELSSGHGAPCRLVAPNRRGFWWVKWIVSVELDDQPWWLQAPFPLT